TWGVDLSGLDLEELVLYSPPTAGRYNSWDDVPKEMKDTYESLGIPQAEREHLAGVVGVWRQEPGYEGLKEAHAEQGMLFGSMGAKYVMLYPGSFLLGPRARADHLNVGVASGGVWKDTGAKVMHLAPETTSNILAKSISKDGGIMGYRGLVRMGHNSQGSKA